MKRYAIVRVDNRCPMWTENFSSFTCEEMFRCNHLWKIGQDTKCRDLCRYGDTKEQLEKKIAQVLFKKFMKTNSRFKCLKKIQVAKRLAYKLSKEIVEFLGVE